MKIWREIGLFEVTEQRLADQARVVRKNGWLSGVELDEIWGNATRRGEYGRLKD